MLADFRTHKSSNRIARHMGQKLAKQGPSAAEKKAQAEKWSEFLAKLAQQEILYRCARSGVDNPDSGLGCYAMRPNNYKEFAAFFNPLIRDYHKADKKAKHVTDWDASKVGENGVLDVTKLGLSELSMRVRVGRNLKKFNLPGAMDKKERIAFEQSMLEAFDKLIALPEFGGKVYSLTPDFGEGVTNPNKISEDEYQDLIKKHVMFKDMSADPYLASAGIASDWPYGRGCYMSTDGQVIVWMGEEDQLRIMVMKTGTKLNEVFDRLHSVLETIEKIPGIEFAHDEDFGYVTSCPSNLGTGMRASVHVKIPKLTADGTDAKAKQICKKLGLSVRGLGGEHTPIGADGTIDLSPSSRLFIRERDIIAKLYEGIQLLMAEEAKLGEAAAAPIVEAAAATPIVEAAAATSKWDAILNDLEKVHKENPDNLCAKYLTREIFNSYTEEQKEVLYRCARSGIDNPDSGLGCYAMRPNDYKEFGAFFNPLIRDYHKAANDAKHVTDWDASSVGENGVLDVSKLGLEELSMRVRVGRNLKKFNLPGAMDKKERIAFEQSMLAAFDKLIAMPEFGGKVYSLTPDFGEGVTNPNKISEDEYQDLIKKHVMFKDMSADPYLASAGIANDWPYGRGCYMSADGQVIVWMGEEDQLRIMVMKTGTKLNEVFDRLHSVLETIEKIPGIEFAHDEDFGYVTSCPSNLGTGMRASVHVKVPKLTADGTDAKAKQICKPLQLSVRGLGGEHTPIGADGTIDLSPSNRLFIRERDIIQRLYDGIKSLMEEEAKL
ncbi:hypothetical protein BASA81_001768 [Batrachochytrium salamandrivorans]|nr:hypothetical protein BASA81_001768 [Batrachochytrium salamandrivorans]